MLGVLFSLLLLPFAAPSGVVDIANPRHDSRWVTDQAGVIDDAVEAQIDTTLDRLHRDTGIEVALVTIEEAEGTPKDLATALFNRWGIGKAGRDNGLLVLLVHGARRIEMETGYGLEGELPDGWLGTMQVSEMVPFFKQGRYGDGLKRGVELIDARLRGTEVPAGALPLADPFPAYEAANVTSSGARWLSSGWVMVPGALVFLIGGTWGIRRLRRWRKRRTTRCMSCKTLMRVLDEAADDQHLQEGQRSEERLGSIDYDVYACGSCDLTQIVPYRRWFSSYGKCPACAWKTLQSSSRTIQAATTSSEGLVEVTSNCRHCNHHSSRTRTTPRIRVSSSGGGSRSSSSGSRSSSSGRSGGSFGGGRSGGGGAGSSW